MKTKKEGLERVSEIRAKMRTREDIEDALLEEIRLIAGEEFSISRKIVQIMIEFCLIVNGFSAEYEEILDKLEDAVIVAMNDGKSELDDISVIKTFEKEINKFKRIKAKSFKILQATAYHEVGHYIVNKEIKSSSEKCDYISIIPYNETRGVNVLLKDKEVSEVYYKSEMIDSIAMQVAGGVSENLKFNEISSLRIGDMYEATYWAYKMVLVLDMERDPKSSLGKHLTYADENGESDFSLLSQKQLDDVTSDANRIIEKATIRAEKILKSKTEEIEILVNALIERGALTEEQAEALYNKEIELSDLPPAKIYQI